MLWLYTLEAELDDIQFLRWSEAGGGGSSGDIFHWLLGDLLGSLLIISIPSSMSPCRELDSSSFSYR